MGERHQVYLRTKQQYFKTDTIDEDSVVGRFYRNSILGVHIQFLMPYESIIFLANLLKFHHKHIHDDGDHVMSLSPLHITFSEYHTHCSGHTDGSYTFTPTGHVISHVEFYFKSLYTCCHTTGIYAKPVTMPYTEHTHIFHDPVTAQNDTGITIIDLSDTPKYCFLKNCGIMGVADSWYSSMLTADEYMYHYVSTPVKDSQYHHGKPTTTIIRRPRVPEYWYQQYAKACREYLRTVQVLTVDELVDMFPESPSFASLQQTQMLEANDGRKRLPATHVSRDSV
ncbi:MAG: hypothetical protein GY801_52785 [bacterium]|nr:hypothetical protein [bacterium]